jgi:SHAQKYF class myb-like DNA-binding protein
MMQRPVGFDLKLNPTAFSNNELERFHGQVPTPRASGSATPAAAQRLPTPIEQQQQQPSERESEPKGAEAQKTARGEAGSPQPLRQEEQQPRRPEAVRIDEPPSAEGPQDHTAATPPLCPTPVMRCSPGAPHAAMASRLAMQQVSAAMRAQALCGLASLKRGMMAQQAAAAAAAAAAHHPGFAAAAYAQQQLLQQKQQHVLPVPVCAGGDAGIRRRERWTPQEHKLFLEGLQRYGRRWTKIQALLPHKTAAQIRVHAYAYFSKVLHTAMGSGDAQSMHSAAQQQQQQPAEREGEEGEQALPLPLATHLSRQVSEEGSDLLEVAQIISMLRGPKEEALVGEEEGQEGEGEGAKPEEGEGKEPPSPPLKRKLEETGPEEDGLSLAKRPVSGMPEPVMHERQ